MKDELKMEDKVNRKISEIIEDCEDKTGDGSGVNDYHLVDYLSGDFLEEQYKGK